MQSKVDFDEPSADPSVDPRRSAIMRRVRGKNTSPEMIVRSALHRAGYRFRLHAGALPGRPDIVFASRKIAIFVHGCFWHRHEGCRAASSPTTRAEFWREKFGKNVERDARNMRALAEAGWRTYIVWECETKGSKPTFWPRLKAFLDDASMRNPMKTETEPAGSEACSNALDEWVRSVDLLMSQDWSIDTRDAGLARDELRQEWSSGRTPTEFVAWFAEKHDLIRFEPQLVRTTPSKSPRGG